MRAVCGCALAGLMLVATGAPAQDKDKGEKIDAAKLVGKWELTGDDTKGVKVTVEFTKDKVIVEIDADGKKEKMEGTYKLDGNKLTLKRKEDGKEQEDTGTITKLTDDELVMLEEGKKKPDTLKRIKEKGKK